MADKKEKHPIVTEYEKAYGVSETYTTALNSELLGKGFVGRETEETLDDVVNFFHSKEVAGMMKKALGTKAKDLKDEEILERYGLPKHTIKEMLSEYESVTPEVLLQLVQQLGARLHAELVSHHPAALANLAYDKGDKAAKAVLKDLYTVSGGDRYASSNKQTIDNLLGPDKIQDHLQNLYQRRELQQRMAQDTEKKRPPYKKPDKIAA